MLNTTKQTDYLWLYAWQKLKCILFYCITISCISFVLIWFEVMPRFREDNWKPASGFMRASFAYLQPLRTAVYVPHDNQPNALE